MIVCMGVAGSGKSLQGRMLADRFGYPWLSTGEFLRMVVAGERRREMLEGKLLSDQEMIAVTEKIFGMIDTSAEFVLDGFPRTLAQSDWLLAYLDQHDDMVPLTVLHMVASREVVKKRLMGRGRADDHEEAIAERFDEYEELPNQSSSVS
jgi:adenylate kinase